MELIAYYIPASTAGVGGSTRIGDAGISTEILNEVELYVVAGGPVFLWFGRKENSDAYNQTHSTNPQNVDFDMAANIYSPSVMEQGSIGMITVSSDEESIGFIKIREIK